MRLRQYITELTMSKKTKIEMLERGGRYKAWRITLEDGDFYDLSIVEREHSPLYIFRKYGLKFDPTDEQKNDEIFDLGKSPKWVEIDFEDSSGDMVTVPKSPKEALQLFAAIEYWFKSWSKKKNPEGIIFDSTGETSKNKLYANLAKRISKELDYINLSEYTGMDEFWLVRKDFKPWIKGYQDGPVTRTGRYVT